MVVSQLHASRLGKHVFSCLTIGTYACPRQLTYDRQRRPFYRQGQWRCRDRSHGLKLEDICSTDGSARPQALGRCGPAVYLLVTVGHSGKRTLRKAARRPSHSLGERGTSHSWLAQVTVAVSVSTDLFAILNFGSKASER